MTDPPRPGHGRDTNHSKGAISGAPYGAGGRSTVAPRTPAIDPDDPDDLIARQIISRTAAPAKSTSREAKIVAVVLGVGVAAALILVIVMATNLIAPTTETPAIPDSPPTPAPTAGSGSGGTSSGGCTLKSASIVLPIGWSAGQTEGGCGIGPAGSPPVMHFREDYKEDLLSLRPKCASDKPPTPTTSETPDPFATGISPSPTRTSPTGSPSPTSTTDGGGGSSGTVKNLQTRVVPSVGGVPAQSESGTIECDGGRSIKFTSVLVTSKKFAITFESSDFDTNYVLENVVFI